MLFMHVNFVYICVNTQMLCSFEQHYLTLLNITKHFFQPLFSAKISSDQARPCEKPR